MLGPSFRCLFSTFNGTTVVNVGVGAVPLPNYCGIVKTRDQRLLVLGRHIRKLREQQELSQEALAEKCGLHRTYLSGVERGTRNVTFCTLSCISVALGTTISGVTSGIELEAVRSE